MLALIISVVAAEPLVCRGFDATTAATAITGASGQLLVLADDLGDARRHQVWFTLAGNDPDAGAQALAHALNCWWTRMGSKTILSSGLHLPPGKHSVRVYATVPEAPIAIMAPLIDRLCEPWRGGDGAIAWDGVSKTWSATLDPAGHARLEDLLVVLGGNHARAPHRIAGDQLPLLRSLSHAPTGLTIAAWCSDLAQAADIAVALGPSVNQDAPPPQIQARTIADSINALISAGFIATVHHGCLCISLGPSPDRQHPAQRCTFACLPIGHLCRTDANMLLLADQIRRRIRPKDWTLPGWGIAALPWQRSLLVSGDPIVIHAVMDALDAVDANGLETWLR